eukprot:Platyproteum_vivax@DN4367_c0_g1_i2.p1
MTSLFCAFFFSLFLIVNCKPYLRKLAVETNIDSASTVQYYGNVGPNTGVYIDNVGPGVTTTTVVGQNIPVIGRTNGNIQIGNVGSVGGVGNSPYQGVDPVYNPVNVNYYIDETPTVETERYTELNKPSQVYKRESVLGQTADVVTSANYLTDGSLSFELNNGPVVHLQVDKCLTGCGSMGFAHECYDGDTGDDNALCLPSNIQCPFDNCICNRCDSVSSDVPTTIANSVIWSHPYDGYTFHILNSETDAVSDEVFAAQVGNGGHTTVTTENIQIEPVEPVIEPVTESVTEITDPPVVDNYTPPEQISGPVVDGYTPTDQITEPDRYNENRYNDNRFNDNRYDDNRYETAPNSYTSWPFRTGGSPFCRNFPFCN